MPQEPGDSRYLYEQIYSELKEEILSGRYKKGDWFPPERVLKERFETTHLTVRNALAKLVLEGYIERYSGKGTIVIYARDRSAAPKIALRFPWVHVILRDLDETNAHLLESLETQMRRLPLAVRVSCHHDDPFQARSLHGEAQSEGALVVIESPGSAAPPLFESAPARTIVLGSSSESGCPQVATDDVEGGRKAARHLLAAGHATIAVIVEPGIAREKPLYQGLLEELAGRKLPPDSVLVQSCGPGVEGAAPAVRDILSRNPDCRAFVCGSDETAVGTLRALQDNGQARDRAFGVIGYGNTRLARAVQITSIDPCVERLAERVVASAREAMSRGALASGVFAVTPELVVRG